MLTPPPQGKNASNYVNHLLGGARYRQIGLKQENANIHAFHLTRFMYLYSVLGEVLKDLPNYNAYIEFFPAGRQTLAGIFLKVFSTFQNAIEQFIYIIRRIAVFF